MLSPELRRRLRDLARDKAPTSDGILPVEMEPIPDYAASFEFRGVEESTEYGPFAVSSCKMSELVPEAHEIAESVIKATRAMGHDPERLLYLDLETCGLSGVPVFLVGTMLVAGNDFEIRQFFARDYSEEKSLLARTSELLDRMEGLVTFNGRSFDVPFLLDRMVRHKLEFNPPGKHVDILHWARRKWKRRLPDCKLQTLESCVCGRYRHGDVPGSEIPSLYHEFVKSGNFEPLIPVLKHNAMDIMTMAELIPKLVEG